MVNSLEDLDVELLGLRRIERHAESHEGIGETLHTDTYGAMAEVRATSFGDGVVIDVDDAVQIVGDHLGYIVQLLEVVSTIGDEGWESKRRKVAHGSFVRGGVLDDLSAKIGRLDGTQVLLVGLVCKA